MAVDQEFPAFQPAGTLKIQAKQNTAIRHCS
jgi:hypothetical protein